MAKRRIGITLALICFCLSLVPNYVLAASTSDAKEPISTDKDCSLAISYCCDGTAFSDLLIKLYKIAEVSEDFQYTLTSAFSNSGLILNGIQTAGEWKVIRSTLETYILAYGIEADKTDATDQNGQIKFETLKPGLYFATAELAVKDGYRYLFDSALIALPGLGADGLWQYQVAVSAKSEVIPPIDTDEEVERRVLKLWKGDSGRSDRPRSIEVEIFRDGVSYQTAILSEDNHWTYSWSAKNDGAVWKVVERDVPSGYMMTVEERETSFVVTNTWSADTPNPPDPPKTGDTANIMLYAVLMNVSGIMLVILGIAGKRKRV